MPVLSTDRLGPQPSAALLHAEAPRREALCVLVVDDAPILRRVIARMLSQQGGHAVREVGTYLEAVALLDAVDAVVTDGFYPYRAGEATGPWGLALARLARAQGKRVIVVSGEGTLLQQAHREGCQALEKPDGIAGLVAALAEAEVPQP